MFEKQNNRAANLPTQQNKGQKKFASAKSAKSNNWKLSAFIILVWGLISGCGGGSPSQQVLNAKAIKQMQSSKTTDQISQAQMMLQASQASLSSYKDYQVGPEDLNVAPTI